MPFLSVISIVAALMLGTPLSSLADDDFEGIIEYIPNGRIGTWVVGSREVVVTEATELEEDDGPLVIGACVEVDYDDGRVEEIEREDLDECQK